MAGFRAIASGGVSDQSARSSGEVNRNGSREIVQVLIRVSFYNSGFRLPYPLGSAFSVTSYLRRLTAISSRLVNIFSKPDERASKTLAIMRAQVLEKEIHPMPKNAFYAQSGGVTSVINASACGVIERAREQGMGKVYAGMNGILGALREELIDTSKETKAAIRQLKTTPSGAFGSCRYKLRAPEAHPLEYERILEVFRAHDIGYFFYNGGGDSQDTANKLAQYSIQQGFPVTCIGIPKTVDNDLPLTDTCPGLGRSRST